MQSKRKNALHVFFFLSYGLNCLVGEERWEGDSRPPFIGPNSWLFEPCSLNVIALLVLLVSKLFASEDVGGLQGTHCAMKSATIFSLCPLQDGEREKGRA